MVTTTSLMQNPNPDAEKPEIFTVPFNPFNLTWRWQFLNLWLMSWRLDLDGDLALVFFNRIAFVKYKQATLVNWKARDWRYAPKHVFD